MASSIFKLTLGLVFGGVILYWMFHDADWSRLYQFASSARPGYLLLGFMLMALSQLIRAVRWRAISNASLSVAFYPVFAASQIGLLLNFLVPARLGELVRTFMLAKSAEVSVSHSLATAVVDKSFDMLFVLCAITALLFFISSHGSIVLPGFITGLNEPLVLNGAWLYRGFLSLGLFMLCLIAVLLVIRHRTDLVKMLVAKVFWFLSDKAQKWTERHLDHLALGLAAFSMKKPVLMSLFWTWLVWFFSYCSVYAILESSLRDVSPLVPFVVLVCVAVLLAVPVVPGLVGQYHIAVIAGLLVFYPDMDKELYLSLALAIHGLTLLAMCVLSLFVIFRGNLPIRSAIKYIKSKQGMQDDVSGN